MHNNNQDVTSDIDEMDGGHYMHFSDHQLTANHQSNERFDKLLDKMKDRYDKLNNHDGKQYQMIKFKEKKPNKKGQQQSDHKTRALYQTATKDFLASGANLDKLSPVDREIFSKVKFVKNIADYEQEETVFNFKTAQQRQPSDKTHNLGGGFKLLPGSNSRNNNGGGSSEKSLPNISRQNATQASRLFSQKQQVASFNQTQQHFLMTQTGSDVTKMKHGLPYSSTPPASSLDQAKRFRQKSLLDTVQSTKDDKDGGRFSAEPQLTEPINAPTLLFSNNAAALKQHYKKNKLSSSSLSKLLPPQQQSNHHLSQTLVNITTTSNNNRMLLTFQEEVRLRKIIKDAQQLDMDLQTQLMSDPLLKSRKVGAFLKDRGIQALMISQCSGDVVEIIERGVSNMLAFVEQQQFNTQNELKAQQIEVNKLKSIIEDRDKQIIEFQDRELTEENIQRIFKKAREEQEKKQAVIEKQIKKLFQKEALSVKPLEPPYFLTMSAQEKDEEDEQRSMNQRRVQWMSNDLDLMTKLINLDLQETARSQIEAAADALLQIESADLKSNVAVGIAQQISTFHVKLEELLKENQRLLKAKMPEKIDRYIQTENWSMERYLEELETLKRRKYITEKENRDLKDKMYDIREKTKKIKEDNKRLLKKTNEFKEKEKSIDQLLADRDLMYTALKKDYDNKMREFEKNDQLKTKEIAKLKELIENMTQAKLNREVELMKSQEEILKKIDAHAKKEGEAKAAMAYFQKQYIAVNEENRKLKEEIETNRPATTSQIEREASIPENLLLSEKQLTKTSLEEQEDRSLVSINDQEFLMRRVEAPHFGTDMVPSESSNRGDATHKAGESSNKVSVHPKVTPASKAKKGKKPPKIQTGASTILPSNITSPQNVTSTLHKAPTTTQQAMPKASQKTVLPTKTIAKQPIEIKNIKSQKVLPLVETLKSDKESLQQSHTDEESKRSINNHAELQSPSVKSSNRLQSQSHSLEKEGQNNLENNIENVVDGQIQISESVQDQNSKNSKEVKTEKEPSHKQQQQQQQQAVLDTFRQQEESEYPIIQEDANDQSLSYRPEGSADDTSLIDKRLSLENPPKTTEGGQRQHIKQTIFPPQQQQPFTIDNNLNNGDTFILQDQSKQQQPLKKYQLTESELETLIQQRLHQPDMQSQNLQVAIQSSSDKQQLHQSNKSVSAKTVPEQHNQSVSAMTGNYQKSNKSVTAMTAIEQQNKSVAAMTFQSPSFVIPALPLSPEQQQVNEVKVETEEKGVQCTTKIPEKIKVVIEKEYIGIPEEKPETQDNMMQTSERKTVAEPPIVESVFTQTTGQDILDAVAQKSSIILLPTDVGSSQENVVAPTQKIEKTPVTQQKTPFNSTKQQSQQKSPHTTTNSNVKGSKKHQPATNQVSLSPKQKPQVVQPPAPIQKKTDKPTISPMVNAINNQAKANGNGGKPLPNVIVNTLPTEKTSKDRGEEAAQRLKKLVDDLPLRESQEQHIMFTDPPKQNLHGLNIMFQLEESLQALQFITGDNKKQSSFIQQHPQEYHGLITRQRINPTSKGSMSPPTRGYNLHGQNEEETKGNRSHERELVKARQEKLQQKKMKQGLEKTLNQLAMGGVKNRGKDDIVEKVLTNLNNTRASSTQDMIADINNITPGRKQSLNRIKSMKQGSMTNTAIRTRNVDLEIVKSKTEGTNNQEFLPEEQEEDEQTEEDDPRWSNQHKEDRNRLKGGDVDIMEYYTNMRPEMPFNGLVLGQPAHHHQLKATDPLILRSTPERLQEEEEEQ